MKYIWIYALCIGLLFASGKDASLHIELKPIAVSGDRVLFATQKYESWYFPLDPCVKRDFGWLVVSAAGIWDERKAYHYNCQKESKERYERYLKGKIDLKNPDIVLKALMKKYGFFGYSTLSQRPYVYAIKPKQSCFKGACLEQTTKQKTLSNLISQKLLGPIHSNFYYQGVALFHNVRDDNTSIYPEPNMSDGISEGASFFSEAKKYNTSYIDGLVLFDPYMFTQPSKKIKKEVEAVAKEMLHLFHTKNIEAVNRRFVHPKYGFYDMYKPGIWIKFKHYNKIEQETLKQDNPYSYLFNADELREQIQWKETDFYCEYEAWTRRGIFIHENAIDYIRYTLDVAKEYDIDISIAPNERERAKYMIDNVYVIVDTEQDISFYIKKIDGRWYITHINRITYCDA